MMVEFDLKILLCFTFLSSVFQCGICFESESIVETKHGKIKGNLLQSQSGRNYLSFRKVPYGKPPLGKLRFEVPEPVDDWNKVFNATSYPKPCAQAALGYNEGSEDCLYLSIYTPKDVTTEPKTKNLPVLVWLHGGSFVTGCSEQYDPRFLMNKDMVLVIPQYRLGILGYFSTRSKFAHGNYGTLDQVLALKWIQENVEAFGGDPRAVTLAGDCAGGASAIYHMFSPLSQGLFHRVMSFSGSPLMPWALSTNANRLTLMMAKELGCPHNNFDWLTHCLRKKKLYEMMDIQQILLEARDMLIGNSKLSPANQRAIPISKSRKVLPNHPLEHLLTGNYSHVPVFLSVTRDVGAYLIDMSIYDFIQQRMNHKSDYLKTLLDILLPELDIYSPQLEVKRFKNYYLPEWDRKTLPDIIPGLSKLLGDTLYNAGIFNLAKILSKETEVRMLRFDYEHGPKLFDIRNPNASLAPPVPKNTVSHGDELFSLFPEPNLVLNDDQQQVANKMLNIVENFVYGREPEQNWSPFTRGTLETSIINSEGELELNRKFPGDEEMLDYIYQSQHFEVIKSLIRDGKHSTKLLVKEEL